MISKKAHLLERRVLTLLCEQKQAVPPTIIPLEDNVRRNNISAIFTQNANEFCTAMHTDEYHRINHHLG